MSFGVCRPLGVSGMWFTCRLPSSRLRKYPLASYDGFHIATTNDYRPSRIAPPFPHLPLSTFFLHSSLNEFHYTSSYHQNEPHSPPQKKMKPKLTQTL